MKKYYVWNETRPTQRAVPRSNNRMKWLPLAALLLAAGAGWAQTYPAGFNQVLVANGLSQPTVVAFAPDGRIFVAEQTGALRVVKNGSLLPTAFVQLTVNSAGERGLIGVALDPDFARNGYVYLYYTVATQPVHNRISRFTANGDVAAPGSEMVLLDLEPLSATNHNGGAMSFGRDGKLYVGVGENAVPSHSQNLDNHLGKVLRLNPDGSTPADNPFRNGSAAQQRIWAYGLRNPYTVAVQPGTGRIFVNDVGQSSWEEVNEATTGGLNFGWPAAEGNSTNSAYTNPLFAYPHGSGDGRGCAITGGTFFNPATTNYPAGYVGRYIYQDFCNQWLNTLDLSGSAAVRNSFATGLPGLSVGVSTGPDGNLYFLSRRDNALYKITYTATNRAPVVANAIGGQSGQVGQGFSFTIPANTFADPDGDALRLSVSGLPAGLGFEASTGRISGTPSTTGTSQVTVTATDPANLAVSTSFNLVISSATAPPSAGFALVGVSTVGCETIAPGQRQLTFTPQYAGLNGQPVSFSVANEMPATTASGPYTLRLYTDNPRVTLQARQGSAVSSFLYNWLAACGSTPPPANRAPVVANAIGGQSGRVNESFAFTIPANTFADPDGDALRLSVSGLPAGLGFEANTGRISGTPSTTGTSQVSVTATDPANLAVSTSFNLVISSATAPPTTTGFALVGVSTVGCETTAPGQRQLTFTPQYTGLNGQPVSFSVANEMPATTASGPYTLRLYTDNPRVTLQARQGSAVSSFLYNWLAACGNSNARRTSEPTPQLSVTVLGNPVVTETAVVDVRGATGESLAWQLTDERGRVLFQTTIERAASVERITVRPGRTAGLYLLRIRTATGQQTVKLVKP